VPRVVELLEPPAGILTGPVLSRVAKYPRLRYMGSKYRVIPHLVALFSEMTFDSVLDAFSGSGQDSDGE
jgi:adenine-specific DNA-methyltransferase